MGMESVNSALSLPHSCGLRSVLDLFGNNFAMVSNQIFSMAAPSLPGFDSFNCAHASSIVDGGDAPGGGVVGPRGIVVGSTRVSRVVAGVPPDTFPDWMFGVEC